MQKSVEEWLMKNAISFLKLMEGIKKIKASEILVE
jgi:hypothetical protein